MCSGETDQFLTHHQQFQTGVSTLCRRSDYLTFGIRLKPLFGIAGGVSKIDQFHLNTSRTRWNMTVDGTVYSSAPVNVEEGQPGEFPETIEERDLSDAETSDYF